MSHAVIKRVVSVEQIKGVWITTVEDSDGNILTGVGKLWKKGDRIITFYDDRYQRPKFMPDNSP